MSEASNWKVYVHINKFNGKRYVGVTSKPRVNNRWQNGEGYKKCPRFYSAIKRYGWDGFEHIVLFCGMSEDAAKEMECLLIKLWDTQDSQHGYNLTAGGDGTCGFHPSAETRAKKAIASRRENLLAETLRKRSEGLRGRKFSDEHKRKIGEGNSKAIDMCSKDGTLLRHFKSAHDAEVDLGISHSHISQCCHNQRKTAGGYCWQFA